MNNSLITCVLHQGPACRNLPQFHHRVFPAGQNVLGVLGEDSRADFCSVVGLLKGRHTAVGDAVPQFDAPVLAAGDVAVSRRVVADAADGVCVLIQRVAGHKALEGVGVVETQGGVLCSHQQKIPRGVEGDGTQHFCFLQENTDRIKRINKITQLNLTHQDFKQLFVYITGLP